MQARGESNRYGSNLLRARESAIAKWLPVIVWVGNAWFWISVVALHVLQPGLSASNDAVSYYVHGRGGWLLTSGLITWAIGSAALVIGLKKARQSVSTLGLGALSIWCVGVFLGGVCAADPPGNWDKPPSVPGAIHGVAAMIAFLVLPVAAMLISPGWMAIGCIVSLIAFFASLSAVFFTDGPPVLLGLTERILLLAYSGWLCMAAVELRKLN